MATEPHLIVAALWADGEKSAEVAAALRSFATPAGYHRGAVVSFKRKEADRFSFREVMRLLNLAEVNQRPKGGDDGD